MNITELVRRAAQAPTDTRYSGDPDCPIASRISTSLLRELDAVAAYMSVSRSDAIRSMLADSVARVYDLCDEQGPNAAGRTVEDCRPKYVEDLSPAEQIAVHIYDQRKTDETLRQLQEMD